MNTQPTSAMKPKNIEPMKKIHQLMDELARRWNEHDAVALSEMFTTNAQFTNELGERVAGIAAIRDSFARPFRKTFRQAILTLNDVQLQSVGTCAIVAHLHWTTTGNLSTSGMPLPPREGVMMLVLERQKEDVWKVAAGLNNTLSNGMSYSNVHLHTEDLQIW